MKVAVFASGNGGNFEQLVLKVHHNPQVAAKICFVLTDQADAFVLERAKRQGITGIFCEPKAFQSKALYEAEILSYLKKYGVELILLAGYMRIIGPTLLQEYQGKILNIHPSLLPQFPGKQGVKDAFEAGVCQTGVTVHLVDEGVDTGPILAQESVSIVPGESIEKLEQKIHQVEHELYPKTVLELITKMKGNNPK
ncbi:phosphoribosylglycinamide formyltransferase [Vagococcus entomophilus]|uniref:Phosphoribosylglycinamide formyltransferase n=1 Tax=Vagococcus entomophilus TaxID=1160095 RepID=A0A430AEV2_9ENTE|nr:phosphoribosylglycinamide formyltransferase [Vagococcus entomophilus]RSU05979.1 phosphoribosylglycinamide formyltransferase [Vagococcus entomophilus]